MMKNMKWLVPFLSLILLTGCIEIQEKVVIKTNGSGQLTVNTDMSQLLGMMESYLGKDEIGKEIPQRVMDTTVMMKDLVDTAKNISAENKALFREGTIHLKLNMNEKILRAEMHLPFSSLNNLQKLYTAVNDGSLSTTDMFKGLTSGKKQMDNNGSAPSADMNQFNSIYDFQCREGLISRKLNAEKWKALQNTSEFSQMKETSNMGIEMPYTLTIDLPRPVKKVDNALATLSENKKTVAIKYNLMEVFQHPEKFEYTIAY